MGQEKNVRQRCKVGNNSKFSPKLLLLDIARTGGTRVVAAKSSLKRI